MAQAQMWERLGKSSLVGDTDSLREAGTVNLSVDALAFFRDNEYDSEMATGYSLPGTWIRPALEYNPVRSVHLELGLSALLFDGANKYPCYVYHDIGKWKGNQYQSGAHVLPWFRAQMNLEHLSIVLGDIYGAENHEFIRPLYNDEQLLSADPEAGLQLLWNSRRFKADLFLNWQSYQFEEDTHQEAFTVGLSARASWLNTPAVHLYSPVQLLLQHRGGEQDKTTMGVQTVCNAAVGLGAEYIYNKGIINKIGIEADMLGCYQQKGCLWHFDNGIAWHMSASAVMKQDLNLSVGCLGSVRDFISIYGNPFFSTQSLKDETLHYKRVTTAYLDFGYSHTFARHYTFGANIELFDSWKPGATSDFNFSFGAYMRITPQFRLCKVGNAKQ